MAQRHITRGIPDAQSVQFTRTGHQWFGVRLMLDSNSHIALFHCEGVPASLLDDFCADVKDNSLNLERVSRPDPSIQAGVEWLAFPFIAVILLKPYFEGFMNEAGKDHYLFLKHTLKEFWEKLSSRNSNFRVVKLTASGEKKLTYSMLFAIYAPGEHGRLVKLLIREHCSTEEFSASLEAFLKLMEIYHSRESEVTQEPDLDIRSVGEDIILLEYDEETHSLRIVDPRPNTQSRKTNSDD